MQPPAAPPATVATATGDIAPRVAVLVRDMVRPPGGWVDVALVKRACASTSGSSRSLVSKVDRRGARGRGYMSLLMRYDT